MTSRRNSQTVLEQERRGRVQGQAPRTRAEKLQSCIICVKLPRKNRVRLLEACHISGWADDENNRTNPKNGLCMTPTFHRAYDKFLMAITPDYEIVLSDEMVSGAKDETTLKYLRDLQGRHIIMQEEFAPEQEFLAQHFEAYRQRR